MKRGRELYHEKSRRSMLTQWKIEDYLCTEGSRDGNLTHRPSRGCLNKYRLIRCVQAPSGGYLDIEKRGNREESRKFEFQEATDI